LPKLYFKGRITNYSSKPVISVIWKINMINLRGTITNISYTPYLTTNLPQVDFYTNVNDD